MSCAFVKFLKWTAGVILSLAVIGNAIVWAADQRYIQTVHVQLIVDKSDATKRRDDAEDKLFELTLVPQEKRTDAQKALIERWKRKLDELNAKLSRTPSGSAQ